MKLKGIHPAEQHFDKVLVGVLGVGLLGIVAFQFLLQPNMVKVGNNAPVAPDKAYEPVERQAAELLRKLETREPKLPERTPVGLGDSLSQVLSPAQVTRGGTIAMGPTLTLEGIEVGINTIATSVGYGVPTPPSPSEIVTASFRSSISPVEQIRVPELAKLLPAEQPFDKAAVSIEGSFSGSAFKQTLEADPDGDGPLEPIPLSWWRDAQPQVRYLIDIVAIEVERETLRTPDGITPPAPATTVVNVPPGRFAGREYWEKSVRSPGDVSPSLTSLEQRSEEIRQPAYYETIQGFAWEAPSEAVPIEERGDRVREVERLRTRLTQIDAQLKKLNDQLQNAPPADRPAAGGGGRSGGAGSGGNQGGGRSGGGGRNPGGGQRDNPDPNQPTANRAVIEQQIRRNEAERTKTVDRLKGLGEAVEETGRVVPSNTPATTKTPLLLDDDAVKVWTHDMNVEPGAEYRYRMRVVVNNPLFGRGLQQQQAAVGEKKVLESEWSEWSAPVQVDRDRYFFVTSAEDSDQLTGRPRASAELIVFYYGYYRSATVGLEPGDAITATVRLPAGLKLADMDKLRELMPKDEPTPEATPGARPNPPGTNPSGPSGPGGPGNLSPGGRSPSGSPSDSELDPSRNPGGRSPGATRPGPAGGPAGNPAGGTEANRIPDWLNVDAKDKVELTEDSVLLDVARLATATQGVGGTTLTRFKAILRRASGALDVRIPEDDRSGNLYKRLSSSVRAGNAATVVKAPVVPGNQTPPAGNQPPRGPANRPPGGGGGGGGGGG